MVLFDDVMNIKAISSVEQELSEYQAAAQVKAYNFLIEKYN